MGDSVQRPKRGQPVLTKSIVIAGAIKSGKTSLSKAIADRLGLSYTSFGDEVRRQAHLAGMDSSDRTVLQELGERLVYGNPGEFVQSVIAAASPPRRKGEPLVLDGLRHLHVLAILRELLGETGIALIYLDAPFDVRRHKAAAHGIASDDLSKADSHASESEAHMLRAAADVVIAVDDDLDELSQSVVTWVDATLG